MIVVYDVISLDIASVYPDNADLLIQADVLQLRTNNLTATQDVFVVVDDAAVIANPPRYLVNTATSGFDFKKSIQITPSINPIELNQSPTMSFQLLDQNLNPEMQSGVAVTIISTDGLVVPSTFTTSASGTNPSTVVLKTDKHYGLVYIKASASGYYDGQCIMTLNSPATASEQNWLEGDDIRPSVITGSKIADDTITTNNLNTSVTSDILAQVAQTTVQEVRNSSLPSDWKSIKKAKIINTGDTGWDVFPAASQMVAGEEYVYLLGYNSASGFNELKQINKKTGAIGLTYSFGDGLTGYNGMAFDGTHVYVNAISGASVPNIYKIDAFAMTLSATLPTIAGTVSLSWDGEYLWALGQDGNMWVMGRDSREMRPVTSGSPLATVVPDRPQAVVSTKDCIYMVANGYNIGVFVKRSKNCYVFPINTFSSLINGYTNHGIATDGANLWFVVYPSSNPRIGIVQIPVWNPDFDVTPTMTASLMDANKRLGASYDFLMHDGKNLWVNCTEVNPSAPYRIGYYCMLRKIGVESIAGQTYDPTVLSVLQTIETGYKATGYPVIDPRIETIYADGPYVWIMNQLGAYSGIMTYRGQLYEDFEACVSATGQNVLRNQNGWSRAGGGSPLSAESLLVEDTAAVAGYKSLSLYSTPNDVYPNGDYAVRPFDNRSEDYIVRFYFKGTAAGNNYSFPAGSNGEGIVIVPESDNYNYVPWMMLVYSNEVVVADDTGQHVLSYNPGTTTHLFEVKRNNAGVLTVDIDNSNYFTGAASGCFTGDDINAIKVAAWRGWDGGSTTPHTLLAQLDGLSVYTGATGGNWDYAKVHVGG